MINYYVREDGIYTDDCVVETIESINGQHLVVPKSVIIEAYKKYCKVDEVDWSKVPVDTKIEVSDDGKHWYLRYFDEHGNEMVLL